MSTVELIDVGPARSPRDLIVHVRSFRFGAQGWPLRADVLGPPVDSLGYLPTGIIAEVGRRQISLIPQGNFRALRVPVTIAKE